MKAKQFTRSSVQSEKELICHQLAGLMAHVVLTMFIEEPQMLDPDTREQVNLIPTKCVWTIKFSNPQRKVSKLKNIRISADRALTCSASGY